MILGGAWVDGNLIKQKNNAKGGVEWFGHLNVNIYR
jgi:hypothetical protein